MYLAYPSEEMFLAFQRMIADFEKHREARFEKERQWQVADFERYVKMVADHREGINLPVGRMPQALYWLLNKEGEILGIGSIRLKMNEFLLREGGQIGYTVVPSYRNQGVGSYLLAALLKKAKDFNIRRLLVTCNEGNIGSKKIIEKNGGVFENKVFSDQKNTVVLRYWVDVE